MRKIFIILIFISIPAFLASRYDYLRPSIYDKLEKHKKSYINWTKGHIVAWGLSKLNLDSVNILSERHEAETAARQKAQLDLINMLVRIKVNTFQTIADYIRENREFAVLFNKYIEDYSKNLMTLTVNNKNIKTGILFRLFGKNSLLEIFYKALNNEPTQRVPIFKNTQNLETRYYSGLVIDARGKNFNPSLFPTIFVKDKFGIQRTIFSFNHLNRARSINNGSIRYTKTAYNVYSDRVVGNRPYFCHADRITGENNTDLFISHEDAVKLLARQRTSKALEEGKILIIVD